MSTAQTPHTALCATTKRGLQPQKRERHALRAVTQYIPVAKLSIGPVYQTPAHGLAPLCWGEQGQAGRMFDCRIFVVSRLVCRILAES